VTGERLYCLASRRHLVTDTGSGHPGRILWHVETAVSSGREPREAVLCRSPSRGDLAAVILGVRSRVGPGRIGDQVHASLRSADELERV
jgi:hypothetical protein